MATALVAMSTALNVAAPYQQGKYEQEIADAQAEMSKTTGERTADIIAREGAQKERSFRKKAKAQSGASIANIGRSGITMAGSPLLVMADVAAEVEREALGIRSSSQYGATSARWQGLTEANLYEQQGEQAFLTGMIGAGSALMQGGSKVYGMGKKNIAQGKSWWA